MNDLIVPNGSVPLLLVFGALPSFPIPIKKLRGQKQMSALTTVREETANIRAEQRITRAIKFNISAFDVYELKSGDEVYAFS